MTNMDDDEIILYDRERDGPITDEIWNYILDLAHKTSLNMEEGVMET